MAPSRSMVVLIAVAGLLLGACAGEESEEQAPAVAEASEVQRTAIEAVVRGFNNADGPESACGFMTRGLEEAIKAGGAAPELPPEELSQPASADCPNVLSRAEERGDFSFTPTQVTIGKVVVLRDRAGALVDEPISGKRPYFLINVSRTWRIVNIGSAPPDFRQLGEALR